MHWQLHDDVLMAKEHDYVCVVDPMDSIKGHIWVVYLDEEELTEGNSPTIEEAKHAATKYYRNHLYNNLIGTPSKKDILEAFFEVNAVAMDKDSIMKAFSDAISGDASEGDLVAFLKDMKKISADCSEEFDALAKAYSLDEKSPGWDAMRSAFAESLWNVSFFNNISK